MNEPRFIVRTWTKGERDFEEEPFESLQDAIEYADGSRLHGYEAKIDERQPDLFGVAV